MKNPFHMLALLGSMIALQTTPETTNTTLLGTTVPNRMARRRSRKGG
jgi:hypothetical protein